MARQTEPKRSITAASSDNEASPAPSPGDARISTVSSLTPAQRAPRAAKGPMKHPCDNCKRKRTKCNSEVPCATCIRMHVNCKYTDQYNKRGLAESMLRHIDLIEDKLVEPLCLYLELLSDRCWYNWTTPNRQSVMDVLLILRERGLAIRASAHDMMPESRRGSTTDQGAHNPTGYSNADQYSQQPTGYSNADQYSQQPTGYGNTDQDAQHPTGYGTTTDQYVQHPTSYGTTDQYARYPASYGTTDQYPQHPTSYGTTYQYTQGSISYASMTHAHVDIPERSNDSTKYPDSTGYGISPNANSAAATEDNTKTTGMDGGSGGSEREFNLRNWPPRDQHPVVQDFPEIGSSNASPRRSDFSTRPAEISVNIQGEDLRHPAEYYHLPRY
ncbi:hypothetical protein AYL99_11936 [Fonsecaea erecta]|uniref:Zn(2)-C6 fungal-type domain-containing protein n=1 Tax=Fonsecaea erecta TaxID=1367422 RepID=A0A178Z2J4_9EURO|nr:hypothetical protein AYL99_11936 [Fonsecaea erecta]OAP53914.1 hypothetical protein AYL99_11936 [Fonsecaea erecta]